MTDRERKYAELGYEYAEGIELCDKVQLNTGRFVYKVGESWEVQPLNDNYWVKFDDLIEAIEFAYNENPVTME